MSIRVLIVDDSEFFCRALRLKLSEDPSIEVVGYALDAYQARDAIQELRPDVLTLDVNMPRMSGVEFLLRLMPQHPLPVVMVSSETSEGHEITLRALEAGAVDFVRKPDSSNKISLESMVTELRTKVKIASKVDVSHWKERWNWRGMAPLECSPIEKIEKKVVVIGASTGGTDAIRKILRALPRNCPGIVIVQHMPPGFTQAFADRLNRQSDMLVRQACQNDKVRPGQVLVAPAGRQLRLRSISQGRLMVSLASEGPVSGHEPSVDVMMNSAAQTAGANAVGVLLTGMGSDGARGLVAMRQAGARTLAQDEDSCIVFGMPREAYRAGGVDKFVPLRRMAETILAELAGIGVRASA